MSATRLSAARTIIGYAFAESVRKRVFAVVIALTAAFLVLYSLWARTSRSRRWRTSGSPGTRSWTSRR